MQPVLGVLLALAAALGSGRAPGRATVGPLWGCRGAGGHGAARGLDRPRGQARSLQATALSRGRGEVAGARGLQRVLSTL